MFELDLGLAWFIIQIKLELTIKFKLELIIW